MRFPGKALAEIRGIPMIERVVRQCFQTSADRVCVVTDDERIAFALRHTEALVIMSPSEIATGTDRVAFAAKDLADDIIINVQGDEPFIPPLLIDKLIAQLSADGSIDMITACAKFEADENISDTSRVKVVFDNNGYALYFSRLPIPYCRDDGGLPVSRYRHIGIYGYRKDFLLKYAAASASPLESAEMLEQLRALENGARIKVVITEYKPVSVDTPDDLAIAEKYLN